MTTPKLDEVRRALDTLKRFVDSFDAFLSPTVARAEGARPAAAIQEPRGRPSRVTGKPGGITGDGKNQKAVLAAIRAFNRPVYPTEVCHAIAETRSDEPISDSFRRTIHAAMTSLRKNGMLKHDKVTRLWSLQPNIVSDRPVTVTRESDNESH